MAEVQHRSQESRCNDQYAGTDDRVQSGKEEQRHAH